MERMRIISVSGLAAAAVAVGLPMVPAQAQPSVIPSGYLGSAPPTRQSGRVGSGHDHVGRTARAGGCRQARRGS